MPDLTAHDLYELVKGLPEEARPEGLQWAFCAMGKCWAWMLPITFPDCGYHHHTDLPHAILLHEASVMRWLAERGDESDYVCVSIDGAGAWISYEPCDGHYPTLLHALVAAAEGVG